jgi:hypothetical protein
VYRRGRQGRRRGELKDYFVRTICIYGGFAQTNRSYFKAFLSLTPFPCSFGGKGDGTSETHTHTHTHIYIKHIYHTTHQRKVNSEPSRRLFVFRGLNLPPSTVPVTLETGMASRSEIKIHATDHIRAIRCLQLAGNLRQMNLIQFHVFIYSP